MFICCWRKLKVSSFQSSDDINENEHGSYHGFGYWILISDPKTRRKEPEKSTVFLFFFQASRRKDWYKPNRNQCFKAVKKINNFWLSDFSKYSSWSQRTKKKIKKKFGFLQMFCCRTKGKYNLHYGWCTGRLFRASTWHNFALGKR